MVESAARTSSAACLSRSEPPDPHADSAAEIAEDAAVSAEDQALASTGGRPTSAAADCTSRAACSARDRQSWPAAVTPAVRVPAGVVEDVAARWVQSHHATKAATRNATRERPFTEDPCESYRRRSFDRLSFD